MGCCECLGKTFQILIYLACLPILVLISAFGFLLWLPIKLLGCLCPCCCACTCILECAEGIFEGIIKLPINCFMCLGDCCGGGDGGGGKGV